MPPEKSSTTTAQTAEHRLARAVAEERTRLLRRHRHRLPSEELDDCLSQAAAELVTRARREEPESGWHPALALEQRFIARISDRRRALAGRSPRERLFRSALADNEGLDETTWIAEPGASVDEQILHRDELRRLLELIPDLADDQRLVLTFRLFGGDDAEAWRIRHGWSVAKFEKTATRARAALAALRAEYDAGERCIRLAPELHAVVTGDATPEERARAARHVRNCRRCAVSTLAARRRRDGARRQNGTASPADRGPARRAKR